MRTSNQFVFVIREMTIGLCWIALLAAAGVAESARSGLALAILTAFAVVSSVLYLRQFRQLTPTIGLDPLPRVAEADVQLEDGFRTVVRMGYSVFPLIVLNLGGAVLAPFAGAGGGVALGLSVSGVLAVRRERRTERAWGLPVAAPAEWRILGHGRPAYVLIESSV